MMMMMTMMMIVTMMAMIWMMTYDDEFCAICSNFVLFFPHF